MDNYLFFITMYAIFTELEKESKKPHITLSDINKYIDIYISIKYNYMQKIIDICSFYRGFGIMQIYGCQ